MKKTIDRIDYIQDKLGILIPASLVREGRKKVRLPTAVVSRLSEERTATQEHVIVFTLDGANKIINKHVVTKGIANQSQIHPREVFRVAIIDSAVSIIIAHNHPSGELEPSEADLVATKRMAEAGKLIGIGLLDHVIVSAEGFLSIRAEKPNLFK
jgi:DNA repair protein RadC